MRVKINKRERISVKKLTNADLGKVATSHQTHIGLSDYNLRFSGSDKSRYLTLLLHEDKIYVEPCEIGKISRKNGKKNAMKVSMGDRQSENLVSRIRKIAANSENDYYLMWFATNANTPVFMLVEDGSDGFRQFSYAFTGVDRPETFELNDDAFNWINNAIGND